MAGLLNIPGHVYLDNNGNALASGKVYTYEAGTSTPKTTYQDQAEATPHANPVILDSNGRTDIWLTTDTLYKIVVKDANDNTISTTDGVTAAGGSFLTGIVAGGDLDMNGNDIITSASNYDIDIQPHGTGKTNIDDPVCKNNLDLDGNNIIFTSGDKFIEPSTSNELLVLSNPASAVNYPQLEGNTTGNNVKVLAKGDDTNIGITVDPKGTGAIDLNADTAVTGDLTVSADTTLSGDLDAPTLDEVTGPFNITGVTSTPGELRILEAPNNGSNYIGLKAPASVSSNVTFNLPSADGSSGDFLKTDGAGTLSFDSPDVLYKLADSSVSAQASLDLTSIITSTYQVYEIYLHECTPATDNVMLHVKVSTDNGSTWEAGTSYKYASVSWYNSTSANNDSSGTSSFQCFSGNISNTVPGFYKITLVHPSTASLTTGFTCEGFNLEQATTYQRVTQAQGMWNSTTAVNAVQVYFSSGNISTDYVVYARK